MLIPTEKPRQVGLFPSPPKAMGPVEELTFSQNCERLYVVSRNNPPMAVIPPAQVAYFSQQAERRRRNGRGHNAASTKAEAFGFLGEVATYHFAGLTGPEIERLFEDGLKGGDLGIDLRSGEWAVDIKTTGQKTQTPYFTLTKTNRFSNRANAYAFIHLKETSDGGYNAYLLGWAEAHHVRQYQRDDEKHPGLAKVWPHTLQQHGYLHPITDLLEVQNNV